MDARLKALYSRIDAFFASAVRADPGAFACRAGCDGCCRQDLTIFGVEAVGVRSAWRSLSANARAAVTARARGGEACVFREPGTGLCGIYGARPLVCRTHGLAVLALQQLDTCPLNYRDGWPAREHVLDLERVNEPLAVVNRLAGFDGSRTVLSDLVLEEEARDG